MDALIVPLDTLNVTEVEEVRPLNTETGVALWEPAETREPTNGRKNDVGKERVIVLPDKI